VSGAATVDDVDVDVVVADDVVDALASFASAAGSGVVSSICNAYCDAISTASGRGGGVRRTDYRESHHIVHKKHNAYRQRCATAAARAARRRQRPAVPAYSDAVTRTGHPTRTHAQCVWS
jgi:hypothetical protein